MIKSELIQLVASHNPRLYLRDVEAIVNSILDEITNALAEGRRVELRGFGAFFVKERAQRFARNPRTGDKVDVPAKRIPAFRAGKEIRDRLNRNFQA